MLNLVGKPAEKVEPPNFTQFCFVCFESFAYFFITFLMVPDLGYLQLRFRGFCRGTSPPSCHSAALSPMGAAKFDGREPVGEAQNAAGDFPRMGWVISRKGSCSGDAVLLPSFGAMQKSDKGGSPTDLRIKCWEKSRGFTSVLSFCGNQGR